MPRFNQYIVLSLTAIFLGSSSGHSQDDRQPAGLRTMISAPRERLDSLSITAITVDLRRSEIAVTIQNHSEGAVWPSQQDISRMCYNMRFRNEGYWKDIWPDPPADMMFSPRPPALVYDASVPSGDSHVFTIPFPRWDMTHAAKTRLANADAALPYQVFEEVQCRDRAWGVRGGDRYSVLVFDLGYLTVID